MQKMTTKTWAATLLTIAAEWIAFGWITALMHLAMPVYTKIFSEEAVSLPALTQWAIVLSRLWIPLLLAMITSAAILGLALRGASTETRELVQAIVMLGWIIFLGFYAVAMSLPMISLATAL